MIHRRRERLRWLSIDKATGCYRVVYLPRSGVFFICGAVFFFLRDCDADTPEKFSLSEHTEGRYLAVEGARECLYCSEETRVPLFFLSSFSRIARARTRTTRLNLHNARAARNRAWGHISSLLHRRHFTLFLVVMDTYLFNGA